MNAPELLEQFLIEGREIIQEATEDLLALEQEPSAERIDRLFRAFHTLKGSVGLFDLPAMGLVLHEAENLLVALRAGLLPVSPSLADRGLETLDQLALWLDAVEATGTLPANAGDLAAQLAAALQREQADAGASAPTGPAPDASPTWATDLLARLTDPADASGPLTAIRYAPLEGCFFQGDDPLALARKVPELVALGIEPREPWGDLAEMDPYTCNLVIRMLTRASRDEIAPLFRLVPDQVTFVEIEQAATPNRPEPVMSLAALPAADRELVQAVIAEQHRVMSDLGSPGGFDGRVSAACQVVVNALRSGGSDAAIVRRVLTARDEALASRAPSSLLALLDEILAPPRAPEPVAPPNVELGTRTLRVEASRIDALVALSGELVVAKNALGRLSRAADTTSDVALLASALRDQQAGLERLVSELHRALMQVRLLPLGQTFRRFARPVRDIAASLGKNVAFRTEGEATEADRTITENLFEPILHILRNALDHGIEAPAERRQTGKPEQATIVLRAFSEGERVVIEVEDDGRGIDPVIIRRIGVERGMVSASEAASLTDDEALELIFAPGFSTAAAVSDLSGRGVGMDAVRAAIHRLGGRVTLVSELGRGTAFHLSLPATMVLTRVMTVQVGPDLFGVALDAIVETVRVARDRIRPVRDGQAVVLRDRAVPVLALARQLSLATGAMPGRGEDVCLLVTEQTGELVALEVDGFGERLDAILKAPEGLLEGLPWIAGTTLLGDGSVLLVLDLAEVVR